MATNNKETRIKVRGKFQLRHDLSKMRFEVERIKTFKTWRKKCPVTPGSLAEAGFRYVGIFDRVECFSCGGQIEGWKEGDIVAEVHKTMYPHCDMVKNQEKKNFTIERWNEMKESLKTDTSRTEADGQAVLCISKTHDLMTSKDYVDAYCGTSFTGKLTSAHAPLFDDELRREDTFRDWPDECKLSHSETKWLANAGFSFTGPGDRARCFYCNGGIENWEEDDEPWSEHARNFPKCEWLIEMKGKAFVDEVQKAKASEEAEKRESKQSPAVSTQSSPADHQKTPASEAGESEKDTKVSAKKLVEIMDSPTVKMILKSKFDAALVCRIIEEQLHETDLNFSTSDNFIKILEAAEQKNTANDKSLQSSASTIDTQTQRFANLEINSDSRQEESPKSGQKSFATAKS
ncbi:baculoviral IAP repeat-containing protein 2 isoform X2 [Strongylocentrotus purpuratus]|uniref:RING-type E3 ubiquitin transferase n=1 Tax=Strongylocentrotus purpuratus TaxID=7668 RepID=A0A7M7HHK6_STRPU|nr:baculoviral IAP repeat-containing protein 2 isoform X2 [Strongylocentrotus purpuratus]|eukprot:XP_011677378.1 PREDICTED: baculoviral IAP repeat-containing protein 2 isoform X2 [Strongylocentrotus purpuratus]